MVHSWPYFPPKGNKFLILFLNLTDEVFSPMTTLQDLLHDTTRGATSIFKDSLKLFSSENDPAIIQYGVEKLKEQFPAMGLFVNMWRQIKPKKTLDEIYSILDNLRSQLMTSFNRVIKEAGNELPSDCSIMTISYSSYVRELILRHNEKINRVYCLESAPEFEGKKLANILNENGMDALTIPDTNYHSPLTRLTHIIIGSDLISENYFINKKGTKDLVSTAADQGKIIWILGDELRFASGYIPENIPGTFEMIKIRDGFRIFK